MSRDLCWLHPNLMRTSEPRTEGLCMNALKKAVLSSYVLLLIQLFFLATNNNNIKNKRETFSFL